MKEESIPPFRLTKEILRRSVSQVWEEAKYEWDLRLIYEEPEGECLCGHLPITEHCVLINRKNGNDAVVGNVCVKRFMGLPSDKLFQAIKRIRKDRTASLNKETILYALRHGWINEWEKEFYMNILRRRNLSTKQVSKKMQINDLVLQNVGKSSPRAPQPV